MSSETAVIRALLERHGLLQATQRVSASAGKLRVLPLGGLGEIGKNMMVIEYDGSIVVVDVGLRFPTAEMLGIDLVLPDFSYLRDRVEDIEAIVITHGHEDHLGALAMGAARPSQVRRAAAGVRVAADDGDGALQARRAQAQATSNWSRCRPAMRSPPARSTSS